MRGLRVGELEGADRIHDANPALGDGYQGVDTPIERIRALRDWYLAVRAEYGDAGLGPVFDFLRRRIPTARLSVRPTAEGIGHLVVAEAGAGVELLPSDLGACVDAVVVACGCA